MNDHYKDITTKFIIIIYEQTLDFKFYVNLNSGMILGGFISALPLVALTAKYIHFFHSKFLENEPPIYC